MISYEKGKVCWAIPRGYACEDNASPVEVKILEGWEPLQKNVHVIRLGDGLDDYFAPKDLYNDFATAEGALFLMKSLDEVREKDMLHEAIRSA